ncbi:MAG TPA: ABC transporter permease [Gemmatimonadaceae bacterium]|nr:ABC transporter permease [Gemmatimonadaceae bacterium]
MSPEASVTIIQPSRGWVSLRLGALWRYRELLYFLVWRDVKVRYKQTVLGASWAILQPFFTMLIFSIFFGKLARMPSDGVPYPLFAYVALVPWTFFANGLTLSSNSLIANQGLLRKVYFPRLVIPLAAVASGLLDFVIAFVVLFGMLVWYGIVPTWHVLWLPALVVLALVTSLGAGLWFSALSVMYRDVQYVVPFLVQVWLYSTPIVYPASLVPAGWRTAYAINPMVGVVEGFRWALLGTGTAPGPMILVSALAALAMTFGGLVFFRRMERTFSDMV